MRNLLRKSITTIIASAIILSSAVIPAVADTTDIIAAETTDIPLQCSSSGGISPYSADDSRINHDITTSKFKEIDSPRAKENATSAYIFISSTLYDTEPILAQIWGCTYEKGVLGNWSYKWKSNSTLGNNGSPKEYVKLYIGTEYQVFNSVHEDGYYYAGLKLKSTGQNCHVMGLWSPDSVNTSGMAVAN